MLSSARKGVVRGTEGPLAQSLGAADMMNSVNEELRDGTQGSGLVFKRALGGLNSLLDYLYPLDSHCMQRRREKGGGRGGTGT